MSTVQDLREQVAGMAGRPVTVDDVRENLRIGLRLEDRPLPEVIRDYLDGEEDDEMARLFAAIDYGAGVGLAEHFDDDELSGPVFDAVNEELSARWREVHGVRDEQAA